MTDKQQIEEMALLIEDVVENCEDDDCLHCSYLNGKHYHCSRARIATALYNAGYRKVGESEMIVTKDEWEKLQGSDKAFDTLFVLFRVLVASLGVVRKETAKDFIFKVESYLGYNADNETFTKKELLLILAEVAKEQYGVEVQS